MGGESNPAMLARAAAVFCLLFAVSPGDVSAGTTGKLTGTVVDQNDQPVAFATIAIVGERLGGYSDDEGRYTIINIPPGTYEVKISRVGSETVVVKDVIISSDQTTWIDVQIRETEVAEREVVVSARALPVELNLTSSLASLGSREIGALPVQELQDVVDLQAGVIDGHFRGGRLGEVDYQVDGVSVNNAYDNKSTLRIDRSILQEVQVISGTFDAEYGQAMSGVVNAVLKEGAEAFEWSAEAFVGDFFFADNDDRLVNDEMHPGSVQNYQLTVSGPMPLANTVFLLNGRYYHFDDFVYGTRLFAPTDSSDFENGIYYPTGDGEEVPLEWSREWSGAGKVTHRLTPDVKLSYNAIFNHVDGQRANNLFRFNPDGLSEQQTFSIAHGVDWTQSVSPMTFFEVNLRQIYLKYTDFVYEDVFDERYDEAGPPVGDFGFGDGAVVQGVEFTRFEHETDGYLAKGSVVSQVTPEHLVKVGGELRMPRVSFGTPGHLRFTTVGGEFGLVRHVDEPPDFPGVKEYRPVIAAGFLQGQMERRDLTLRAGLRVDYFDARTWVPGDPANPANAIAGAPLSVAQETTAKVSVSPRLGVAYPIRDRAAIHFAYGHFTQFPAIGEIFNNADYKVLSQLQAGGTDYGVMGNPDIEPEKTVQYEIGYKQAVTDQFGVDVTTFFKDVRDLLGVEFISTYNDAEYARLTNADFGQVVGVTVALDYREFGDVSLALDYTWQRALGNASDPRETATRAEAGEDPRPRQVAFDWDQRHTFNMTAALSKPRSYSLSAVLQAASGQPYTPVIESGFGHGLEANSGRKPSGVILNLRAERPLPSFGPNVSLFARVFNLLDTRFFNGAVYPSTGSPYYSRFTEADRIGLADPTRFYPPRRIEVGVSLGSEPR